MSGVEQSIEGEVLIRLGSFLAILLAMLLWEQLDPRRPALPGRVWRRTNNLLLLFFNALLLKLIMPFGAVALAFYVQQQQWGLLNQIQLPLWLSLLIAVVLLDLLIYWQHRLFHVVKPLWRLHQVHHADMDYDTTTGLRFHPLEIMLSMLIKFVAIVLLGPAAMAVLAFELLLNGSAMFNHGNIRLPNKLDQALRWLIVTPDMHRIHHSIHRHEADSNYGFALSLWDRLFGSYRQEPQEGQVGMRFGVKYQQNFQQTSGLWALLKMPFTLNPAMKKNDD
ncbi:MAG: sterol desaturase family protein [Gammaproteobacteria bacterium]|nr:sterol desaturase family protein [Gammaproteobacteria bacterium]MCF6230573.1 sterol desaturase family protein [Gammaproteobacteria bacterium]